MGVNPQYQNFEKVRMHEHIWHLQEIKLINAAVVVAVVFFSTVKAAMCLSEVESTAHCMRLRAESTCLHHC